LEVFHVIHLPAHLGLDVVSAGLLLAVPWFFGFPRKAKGAYTAEGLLENAVILTSQTTLGLTAGHARRQRGWPVDVYGSTPGVARACATPGS
jgi:hypothetical protein